MRRLARFASRGGSCRNADDGANWLACVLTKSESWYPSLWAMRSQGCRDLLVYCNSDRCNHSTIINVGHLPDHTPIKSLGDGFVCAKCGHLGADAVPNWQTSAVLD